MSPLVLGKPTVVRIGRPDGTWADVTDYVKSIHLEQATYEADLDKPIVFQWSSPLILPLRGGITPRGYRLLFNRTHPRISRMHRAYRTRQLARRRRR